MRSAGPKPFAQSRSKLWGLLLAAFSCLRGVQKYMGPIPKITTCGTMPAHFIALARTPVRALLCAPHFRPTWCAYANMASSSRITTCTIRWGRCQPRLRRGPVPLCGPKGFLKALGPSSCPIFVLAWCPLADMAPTSKITRARLQPLRTACIRMPTSRPLWFQEPEVRSSCYEHRSSHRREDAGETPAVQDGTSHRCSENSLPCSPPARSGRGLDLHACVVCASEHEVHFENDSPSAATDQVRSNDFSRSQSRNQ